MCTVALNRPPTQNGDHVNPPDISADRNTNVCFRWGENKQQIKSFLVKESVQSLPWTGYFWRLDKKLCKSKMTTDPAAFKVVSLDFMVKNVSQFCIQ